MSKGVSDQIINQNRPEGEPPGPKFSTIRKPFKKPTWITKRAAGNCTYWTAPISIKKCGFVEPSVCRL
jgi:hypothetical protein